MLAVKNLCAVLPIEGNPVDQYKVCGKRPQEICWQKKKNLLKEKLQEKRTWGLCTQTLKFTFDAAARQGCNGAVPYLVSDGALRQAVPSAAARPGKAAVGLVQFAQLRACPQLKSRPGAAVLVCWLWVKTKCS